MSKKVVVVGAGLSTAMALAADEPTAPPEDQPPVDQEGPEPVQDFTGKPCRYICADCKVKALAGGIGEAEAKIAAIRISGFREIDGKLYCVKDAKKRGYKPGKVEQ
jgi:hypothetical protein